MGGEGESHRLLMYRGDMPWGRLRGSYCGGTWCVRPWSPRGDRSPSQTGAGCSGPWILPHHEDLGKEQTSGIGQRGGGGIVPGPSPLRRLLLSRPRGRGAERSVRAPDGPKAARSVPGVWRGPWHC